MGVDKLRLYYILDEERKLIWHVQAPKIRRFFEEMIRVMYRHDELLKEINKRT